MQRGKTPLLIRVFWSIVYFFTRYRYVSLAFILAIATLLTYQYWQGLKQNVDSFVSLTQQYKSGRITMKYPKSARKNDKKELIFIASSIERLEPETLVVKINVSPDESKVEPKEITLFLNKNNEFTDAKIAFLENFSKNGVKISVSIISTGNKVASLSGTIRFDRFSRETLYLLSVLSTILSGVSAFATLILQFREMLRRHNN